MAPGLKVAVLVGTVLLVAGVGTVVGLDVTGSTSGPPATTSSAPTTTATTTSPGVQPSLATAPPGRWLLSGVALDMLLPNPVARSLGASPNTYLIVNNKLDLVPQGSRATLVASYTSYSAINYALTHATISPRIKAILYDYESWSLTPRYEQLNYVTYEQRAEEVAHQHGLLLIATPSVGLANVLEPGSEPVFSKYLSLGIAANAARYADVVDIQAQGSQLDPSKYADFVTAATAQARAANPNVVVLAGISTNPSGPSIPLSDLLSVVQQTMNVVDGYWLNVPVPGVSCPDCNAPQPQLADALLDQLAAG